MSSAEPRRGGAPTVTAVLKFLRAAGFQHSRHTDAKSSPIHSGAYVRKHGDNEVLVTYREGDHDFFERMQAGGYTDVADVPESPLGPVRAREYAEVLSPRYTVKVVGRHVHVTARSELPARPKGVPSASVVRTALRNAEIVKSLHGSATFSVVDQPDHTRVAVFDEEYVVPIAMALTAEGWIFEQSETMQHYVIKITGAVPDRRRRVYKLKAERAVRQEPEASNVSAPEELPLPQEQLRPVETAPTAQKPAPEAEPEVPLDQDQPIPRAYGNGTAYAPGMRVTYRDRSGFWRHGKVTEVYLAAETRKPHLRFTIDAYQVAPRRRSEALMPNHPGKRRPGSGVLTVALDDKDLSRERTE